MKNTPALYEENTNLVLRTHRPCMKNTPTMYEEHTSNVWRTYQPFMKNTPALYEEHTGLVWRTHQNCMKITPALYEKHTSYVWKITLPYYKRPPPPCYIHVSINSNPIHFIIVVLVAIILFLQFTRVVIVIFWVYRIGLRFKNTPALYKKHTSIVWRTH